jgi:hypothetical protein
MARGFHRTRDGHSSATPVARRLKQPTRTATRTRVGAVSSLSRGQAPLPSLFGLAPGGVCRAAAVAGSAVRSYRTVSPLPRPTRYAPRRSVLCGTVPGVAPAGSYPAPFVLEPGLSSPAAFRHWRGAAVRPTDGIGNGARRFRRQEAVGSPGFVDCAWASLPAEARVVFGNPPSSLATRTLRSVSRVDVSVMPSILAGRK